MAIFGPKPWVNPFGNISISRLFKLFFYSLERRFVVLEYCKTHFPCLYCLKKKKLPKMAIFGPKPWVKPFGKWSMFRLSEHFVFIA